MRSRKRLPSELRPWPLNPCVRLLHFVQRQPREHRDIILVVRRLSVLSRRLTRRTITIPRPFRPTRIHKYYRPTTFYTHGRRLIADLLTRLDRDSIGDSRSQLLQRILFAF